MATPATRTWNLWWRLGDWEARADAVARTLEQLRPDLVRNWPSGPGGLGHSGHAEVLGMEPRGGVVPSDHYALAAELRY